MARGLSQKDKIQMFDSVSTERDRLETVLNDLANGVLLKVGRFYGQVNCKRDPDDDGVDVFVSPRSFGLVVLVTVAPKKIEGIHARRQVTVYNEQQFETAADNESGLSRWFLRLMRGDVLSLLRSAQELDPIRTGSFGIYEKQRVIHF